MANDGRIRLAILDRAGTTVDYGCYAPTVVFMEVFRRQGVEISVAQARAPMGRAKREHIKAISEQPEVATKWRNATGQGCTDADVDEMFEKHFRPLDIAEQMFYLKEGLVQPEVAAAWLSRLLKSWATTKVLCGDCLTAQRVSTCFLLFASDGTPETLHGFRRWKCQRCLDGKKCSRGALPHSVQVALQARGSLAPVEDSFHRLAAARESVSALKLGRRVFPALPQVTMDPDHPVWSCVTQNFSFLSKVAPTCVESGGQTAFVLRRVEEFVPLNLNTCLEHLYSRATIGSDVMAAWHRWLGKKMETGRVLCEHCLCAVPAGRCSPEENENLAGARVCDRCRAHGFGRPTRQGAVVPLAARAELRQRGYFLHLHTTMSGNRHAPGKTINSPTLKPLRDCAASPSGREPSAEALHFPLQTPAPPSRGLLVSKAAFPRPPRRLLPRPTKSREGVSKRPREEEETSPIKRPVHGCYVALALAAEEDHNDEA